MPPFSRETVRQEFAKFTPEQKAEFLAILAARLKARGTTAPVA